MPTYEYQCDGCGKVFEATQRITEDPLKKHPECGSKKVKRLISRTSFQLKGTGWYVTDYAGKKSSDDAGDDAKSDTKAEGDKADKTKIDKTETADKAGKADKKETKAEKSAEKSESKAEPKSEKKKGKGKAA